MGKYLHESFENKTLNISSVSVVGFSSGAHIGSAIGQTVFRMSGNTTKLPRFSIAVAYFTTFISRKLHSCRVTGLDPAGLFFNPKTTAFLTKQDAEFVDVIHTDGGIYGTTAAVASADFYPNDGVRAQSGCSVWTFPFSLTLSGMFAIFFLDTVYSLNFYCRFMQS